MAKGKVINAVKPVPGSRVPMTPVKPPTPRPNPAAGENFAGAGGKVPSILNRVQVFFGSNSPKEPGGNPDANRGVRNTAPAGPQPFPPKKP